MIDSKKRLEKILTNVPEKDKSIIYNLSACVDFMIDYKKWIKTIAKEFVHKDNLPSEKILKTFLNNLIYFEEETIFYNRKPFNATSDWFPIDAEYLPELIAEAIRKLIEGNK